MTLLTQSLAPTNTLLGNPAALKRAWQTRGQSLLAGARNALRDMRHNGAMPSMVDTRPFAVGTNLAVTPAQQAPVSQPPQDPTEVRELINEFEAGVARALREVNTDHRHDEEESSR